MEAQRARRRQKEVRLHGPVPMAQHIVMGNELRRLREGARLRTANTMRWIVLNGRVWHVG